MRYLYLDHSNVKIFTLYESNFNFQSFSFLFRIFNFRCSRTCSRYSERYCRSLFGSISISYAFSFEILNLKVFIFLYESNFNHFLFFLEYSISGAATLGTNAVVGTAKGLQILFYPFPFHMASFEISKNIVNLYESNFNHFHFFLEYSILVGVIAAVIAGKCLQIFFFYPFPFHMPSF